MLDFQMLHVVICLSGLSPTFHAFLKNNIQIYIRPTGEVVPIPELQVGTTREIFFSEPGLEVVLIASSSEPD